MVKPINLSGCSIKECTKPFYAKGYCSKHYQRLLNYGNPKQVFTKTTHGKSNTPPYWIWAAMVDRCRNPNNKRWNRYGGRGIKVCEQWTGKDGFANFYAIVGDRPKGKTLDRINNNGNYEPDNVRWATYSEQANNKN